MTAHAHDRHVEGCYRCELSRDEVAALRETEICPACAKGDHVELDRFPGECSCWACACEATWSAGVTP